MTGEDGANGGCALKAGVIWHLPGVFGGDDGAADATARRAAASRPVVLANLMVCLVLRFVLTHVSVLRVSPCVLCFEF